MFIGEVFPIEVSDGLLHSLGSCQKVNLYPARVITGHEFLGVCMRLEFEIITPMHVQNSIFNGEVFQIEVSDGLVRSL